MNKPQVKVAGLRSIATPVLRPGLAIHAQFGFRSQILTGFRRVSVLLFVWTSPKLWVWARSECLSLRGVIK
jgi:hypothetical protein